MLFLLRDPGGFKKSVKEIEEEKFATYMWELFVTNTKVLICSLGTNPIFQAFILFVASLNSLIPHFVFWVS